ncbi:Bug family tripartite tricarboxylate transporter substrate binding protein [Aquabacterium sp.]|uniref:Bug family tripartite tricarboxylate transporter substrate binding protein n=1 Tax=Aquabacterium sp. TaxID=1872578 RepID=UPI003BB13A57
MHISNRKSDRRMLTAALAITVTLVSLSANAKDDKFPSKPVKLVSAYSLGSGADTVLRAVAERLSRKWGQPVRVDNRPGGAGFVAINHILNARPDGYTLLQLDSEQLAAMPHLQKGLPFDPVAKFDAVTTLFRTPFLVSVPNNSKWKNLNDLIADSKVKPQAINYGSWGIGSAGHLGGALFESRAGINTKHVPYTDFGQLNTAISSGTVSWGFSTLGSSEKLYKAGKIRYLAITSDKRTPKLPQVPTVAESGGPATFNFHAVVIMLTPKGTPQQVVDKVHADIQSVLVEPSMRELLSRYAYEPLSWGQASIMANAPQKLKQYERLIKSGEISAD